MAKISSLPGASIAAERPAPDGHVCETCKAFNAGLAGGECHLKSPLGTLVPGPGGQPAIIGFWPSTRPDGWCLEWQARSPISS